ncbi:MAG: signal recognition particle protein [Verrucomicrobia bacterium]|nr:signal recognition particle protein [Verrucomicrobiota bacterium]MDA1087620.1 signal recognition particle protein [Verrucomicrobiota bacterium]
MFDSLSTSLQGIFKRVRGHGRLSEENVQETMREVRLALLEADVHVGVVKEFIGGLKDRCLGHEVLESVTPGQQFVKLVQDQLTKLLGSSQATIDLNGDPATLILLGLHGSGKTTTAGKLAAYWKRQGKNVLLVAGDIRRPAAVEQLTILGQQIGVDVLGPQPGEALPDLGQRALESARRSARELVIYDTGGRFQIDDELVSELAALKRVVKPHNVILVADAALGQESVAIAESFHERVNLTGLILTKLDGDARGGAALSIRSMTGCPIVFTGTGEKIEDLEPFYPDRMASRILGMGDVVSLVEKAEQAIDVDSAERMGRRLQSKSLNLEDFLDQLQQMKKMGPLENLMDMLPIPPQLAGVVKAETGGVSAQAGDFARKAEAIIQSMTPRERRNPKILDGSRRKRIAAGSGVHPSDVNELIRRFQQARKMSKKMLKMQKNLKSFV